LALLRLKLEPHDTTSAIPHPTALLALKGLIMTPHISSRNSFLTFLGRSLRSGLNTVGLLAVFGSSSVLAQSADLVPMETVPTKSATPVPVMESPAEVMPVPSVEIPEIAPPEPSLSILSSPETSLPAAANLDESYIDSTDYSIGATQRSSEIVRTVRTPQFSLPSGSVQAGPLTIEGGRGGFGETIPLAKNFYNRTLRPIGRLGNGNVRLLFPISIPAAISSAFGWRLHPITGTQRFHSGTDISAPIGTPVLAALAGQVAIADFLGGYGLTITLEHEKGTQQTLYAHLSEIFVQPGEMIEQGAVIGRVGNTGLSTGPHLHFEFRQLTPDGWVAMDAGEQLEYALAQLAKAFSVTQTIPVKGVNELAPGTIGEVNIGARG
jgi:murein DD-endopeptidase MepM/ murein hydrolase activator NlpD